MVTTEILELLKKHKGLTTAEIKNKVAKKTDFSSVEVALRTLYTGCKINKRQKDQWELFTDTLDGKEETVLYTLRTCYPRYSSNNNSYVSVSTLYGQLVISRRSVQRALDSLIKKGLVERVQRDNTNLFEYQLTIPEALAKKRPYSQKSSPKQPEVTRKYKTKPTQIKYTAQKKTTTELPSNSERELIRFLAGELANAKKRILELEGKL